jgi:hypothetical protein
VESKNWYMVTGTPPMSIKAKILDWSYKCEYAATINVPKEWNKMTIFRSEGALFMIYEMFLASDSMLISLAIFMYYSWV